MRKTSWEREWLEFQELARQNSSDKWTAHNYSMPYFFHFMSRRYEPLKILEIGVGGYQDDDVRYARNDLGGESLRFWKAYFPRAEVYALDLEDKSELEEERIKIFRGDQSDPSVLHGLCKRTGPLDIVIDDGSHINQHVLSSFACLFPLLSDRGIYVVEDCQTSYWDFDGYGGDPLERNSLSTIMGYFKSLADGVNHAEFPTTNYQASYFEKHIESIHFHHNLIFIRKGFNQGLSNMCSRYPLLRRDSAPA